MLGSQSAPSGNTLRTESTWCIQAKLSSDVADFDYGSVIGPSQNQSIHVRINFLNNGFKDKIQYIPVEVQYPYTLIMENENIDGPQRKG